ncbi:MAG: hypothetical protein ABI614_11675 [Planctomycetota bacterium]
MFRVTLYALVSMKLTSYRDKDRMHLRDMINRLFDNLPEQFRCLNIACFTNSATCAIIRPT